MLSQLTGLYTAWMWAVLLAFWRYMLPMSSGFKFGGSHFQGSYRFLSQRNHSEWGGGSAGSSSKPIGTVNMESCESKETVLVTATKCTKNYWQLVFPKKVTRWSINPIFPWVFWNKNLHILGATINSQNGPMKAKYADLCTSGCCRLRNTLLVKLCTSWDDGATAGNSLENRFVEYLAVMQSCCAGCQECQQIFMPSQHILILERAKNRRGVSQVNKVDGPFL
jgi:hypothetical protein